MVPIALEAAEHLIMDHEVFCEVVALSSLLPLDLEPVLASLARTGAVVTLEEGSLTAGVGAEIAARVQEEGWDDLRRPVRRVAARDGIIPSAPQLEEAVLPGVDEVTAAVLALVGAPA
jgi:pyruvate dehydrogenase E1 component beta subunit